MSRRDSSMAVPEGRSALVRRCHSTMYGSYSANGPKSRAASSTRRAKSITPRLKLAEATAAASQPASRSATASRSPAQLVVPMTKWRTPPASAARTFGRTASPWLNSKSDLGPGETGGLVAGGRVGHAQDRRGRHAAAGERSRDRPTHSAVAGDDAQHSDASSVDPSRIALPRPRKTRRPRHRPGVAALGALPWPRGSSRTPPSLRAEPPGWAANAWTWAWRGSERTLSGGLCTVAARMRKCCAIMQSA